MDDSPMMMEWFGESWGAPINEDCPQTIAPYGKQCFHCEELIAPGDSGVIQLMIRVEGATREPAHLECFIRMTIGSYGHITGQCPCNGGDVTDPPGVSTREAARAAYRAYQERYDL